MKTSTTFKSITLIALLGAALSAPVLAQGGPGMGPGMGAGCANAAATANGGAGSCLGNGGGMGRGAGMGMGGGYGMMAQQNGARGWTLMTPEERSAFQTKMRTVKTYDECTTVQSEHRSVLEGRAKDKGITLMTPRGNVCDMLRAHGVIM